MTAPRRPATLRAMADHLGLHVSTVSRVLHAKPQEPGDRRGPASPETAERVRRLAAEWGYLRNPHASGLRTNRSDLIAVLVPRLSDLVLALIYEGIDAAAAEQGLTAFVMNTQDDPELQRRRTRSALERRVDGMIFGDAAVQTDPAERLDGATPPFVLVNRRSSGHVSATCDDELGGRLAARHLLALGHSRIAVAAGPSHASTAVDRTAGFLAELREHGVTPLHVLHSALDTAGGHDAAVRMLDDARRPSAVFSVNDFAAVGVMGAARTRGLEVGRDLAVVGFNDVPIAAELPVPLTSVRSPLAEIGRQAVRLLVAVIEGGSPESVRLAPELVARESTTPAPSGR